MESIQGRYTGLRPDHVEALRDPGSAFPSGSFQEPSPLVEASWEEIRGIGRRLPDAKCLHFIARHPGLALRFLRQTFGNAPLERLRSRGWIRIPEDLPWEAWPIPVEPTGEGLRRLRETLGPLTEREREAFF
jgi:hypothetical protein